MTDGDVTVKCKGISGIYGTGPFAFGDRTNGEVNGENIDMQVTFLRNNNYWGDLPDIETLQIVYYESATKVEEALLDGTLDVVWGAGVLQSNIVSTFERLSDRFAVFHSGVIHNTLLLLNSGKAPLNDINVRKALVHAIDKKGIIETELGEDNSAVDNVFPLNAPYCNVNLTPKWDFDEGKAKELNCAETQCTDSPLKMLMGPKKKVRGCKWVASKPAVRCKKKNVARHCPNACNTVLDSCNMYKCKDTAKKFKMKKSWLTKNCKFIENNPNRCWKSGVKETCRGTCGLCET